MKIIHVTYDARPYGITTFLLSLLRAQRKMYPGMETAVALHAGGECLDDFVETGARVYDLDRKSAKDVSLLFRFYRLFREYDLVNLHTYSPWAFLAAKLARRKVVFTFHGATGLRGTPFDFIIRLYYRILIRRLVDRITFASRTMLCRYYLEMIDDKLGKDKIEMFPYGLDLSGLKADKTRYEVRRALGLDDHDFVVGTAARMDPMKMIERLIESFSLVAADDRFKLVIAGSGSAEYEAGLKKLAAERGLGNRVFFLGYVREILDLIGALDLFVLPSRDEPFGLALLESMFMGTPSAVFPDAGGPVEILGESGILVNTSQELAEAITRLSGDNTYWEKLSKSVKERAALFDISYTAANLDRIYRSLLGE